MKAVLEPDHILVNKYVLSVSGIQQDLVFTKISGIEEELDKVELPDRTYATGGRTKPFEFEGMLPLHHVTQQAAMEDWFAQTHGDGRLPNVDLAYLRTGTLRIISGSGNIEASFSVEKLFPCGRGLPDLEMNNEGDMAETTWKFAASDIRKLP